VQAKLEDQHKVLAIAEIDLRITSLNQKINTMPEALLYKELSIQLDTTRDLRIAAETELSDLSGEINRAENDVEQVVKRIEKDEARLNAGQGSPKELEQLQHELISLAGRRAELEEIELEVMLRADEIKSRIQILKSQESELQSKVVDAEKSRDLSFANFESDIKEALDQRSNLIPQIDKALFELYEKVRSGGVIGAARLKGGQCGGCNLAINSGDLSKLMALPEEEVARCEECRCILIRQ
jgi:predicted  nucleic acid-binding Zn-ribbon protein